MHRFRRAKTLAGEWSRYQMNTLPCCSSWDWRSFAITGIVLQIYAMRSEHLSPSRSSCASSFILLLFIIPIIIILYSHHQRTEKYISFGISEQIIQYQEAYIIYCMKEGSGKSSIIKFQNNPIRNCRIYALHRAFIDGEQKFVKVFNNQLIAKYALDETLEFNVQLLTESPNFIFPDNFLHIEATHNEDSALIFITKPYETRLDQFLKGNPLNEKQALMIFQDILKAAYSFIMEGFWHRNLRADHFVKVGNKWKLENIVYEEKVAPQGINSQFLYNAEYQPPEAYERPNFTDSELDQRIVWDLGCILIHMLTGFHKLKNQAILLKFEKQPFSLGKIAGNLQSKISIQLLELLARMCHYNQNQRMTIDELILNGFFSPQIAEHYKKHKQNKKKGLWTSNSQSVSKSVTNRNNSNNKQPDIGAAKKIADNLRKSAQRQDELLSSSNGTGEKLFTKKQFEQKIFSIIEDENQNQVSSHMNGPKNARQSKIEKLPSFDQIKNVELNEILDIYKNYIDKGDILGIGSKKFDQMLLLFEDKKLGRELADLTEYALNFVKAMFICKLAAAMNQNKSFFEFNGRTWEKFHGSQQYQSIKKIVNFKRKQAMNQVFQLKQKLTKSTNRFKDQKPIINSFVTRSKPDQSEFIDIKQPYRKILKLSYDLIAEHYTNNKTQEWARLGMYITYCLAIDKFYIHEEFKSNFEYFFKWSKKAPSNYVPLDQFQQYLDNAPRVDLVQNSRYIMKKFFQI